MSGHFRPVLVATVVLAAWPVAPARADEPPLVVLRETGRERAGVPVYETHPRTAEIAAAVSRGFGGRWLRLFHHAQVMLHRQGAREPEPAYLLLSDNRGGFPRFGFFLGEHDKRHAGYVDLHRDTAPSGRLGALDQMFPHELAHVMLRLLAGPFLPGGSNQIHAVGVRTDPQTAFEEGFAEHVQVLVVDDPAADPSTRAAAGTAGLAWTQRMLDRYRRELVARWSPGGRQRMTFPLWYSRVEQSLRYHGVKTNAFARAPRIPEHLLRRSRLYDAYLLDSVVPGAPDAAPRAAARMVAVEGVIASLFHRWVNDPRLQGSYREPAFYAAWGLSPADVDPLDHAYLKIFDALHRSGARDAVRLIDAYREVFPDDADAIDAVVRDTLLGRPLPRAPELWLANDDFRVGTTPFDQFGGVPRVHTFDLNAASLVDLLGVRGVDRSLAEAIARGAPYAALADLRRVPGITPELLHRFEALAAAVDTSGAAGVEAGEDTASLLAAIVKSYLRRALVLLALAAVLGAALYRLAREVPWWRAACAGLAAALAGLLAAWSVDAPPGWPALLVPLVVFGLPASLWEWRSARSTRSALRVLAAWLLAALPAAVLTRPWGG